MLMTNKNYKQRDFEAWFAANVVNIYHFIANIFFLISNPPGIAVRVVCHEKDLSAVLSYLSYGIITNMH